jgi:hypothetical protein
MYDVPVTLAVPNRLGLSVAELRERETERKAEEKLLQGEKTRLNASNKRTSESIRPPTHSANSNLAPSGNQVRKDALVNVHRSCYSQC